MMTPTNVSAMRACLLVAGLAGGAYCGSTAFLNGLEGATGWAGYALATSGLSVAFGSWFILPFAAHVSSEGARGEAWMLRFGWALCTAFVLWNATGFTAIHRTEKVSTSQVSIDAYNRAETRLSEATAELNEYKKNKRWEATNGCSNATVDKSREFCGQVAVTKSNISTAETTLAKGRPGAADAQAESIGWLLQLNPALVSKLDPVLKALIQEIAMSLFLLCAFRPSTARKEAVTVKAPVAKVADFSPIFEAITAATAEINAARAEYDRAMEMLPFLRYEALLATAADLFVEPEADILGYVVQPAPAVEAVVAAEVQIVAPQAKKAKKAQRNTKADAMNRRRDANGRYAKKAKLIAKTDEPKRKPQLSALPLNGAENVVIFGTHPKKD